jgi:dienelactone hydrolase
VVIKRLICVGVFFSLLASCLGGEPSLAVGKSTLMLRGRNQDLYIYAATGRLTPSAPKVLFLPGDGGWRGFAITIAQTIASWGYDVCGLDTKQYLENFTGKTTLTDKDVAADILQVAHSFSGGTSRVIVVGWSEGAGLCLLAAAAPQGKQQLSGLVTLGLPESAVLGWRWSDYLTYVTKQPPNEPTFKTSAFLPRVAPLPIVMIHSTQDEYVPAKAAKELFSAASEPKQFWLIEARNHRFDGNTQFFFQRLREALQWIAQSAP